LAQHDLRPFRSRASVANLADHANLQQPSNEERAQLIRAAATSPEMSPEKKETIHGNNTSRDRYGIGPLVKTHSRTAVVTTASKQVSKTISMRRYSTKGQLPLHCLVRSWSQTYSELKFGLSSGLLAAN